MTSITLRLLRAEYKRLKKGDKTIARKYTDVMIYESPDSYKNYQL